VTWPAVTLYRTVSCSVKARALFQGRLQEVGVPNVVMYVAALNTCEKGELQEEPPTEQRSPNTGRRCTAVHV